MAPEGGEGDAGEVPFKDDTPAAKHAAGVVQLTQRLGAPPAGPHLYLFPSLPLKSVRVMNQERRLCLKHLPAHALQVSESVVGDKCTSVLQVMRQFNQKDIWQYAAADELLQ